MKRKSYEDFIKLARKNFVKLFEESFGVKFTWYQRIYFKLYSLKLDFVGWIEFILIPKEYRLFHYYMKIYGGLFNE